MNEFMLSGKKKGSLIGSGPDPHWNKTVLLMRMDGDRKDESANNIPSTVEGTIAFTSPSSSDFSNTGRFAGSSALVMTTTSSGIVVQGRSLFGFLAGVDFTIEAWIYSTSVQAFKQILGQWGVYNSYQMSLYSGRLGWETPTGGSRLTDNVLSLNTWHHCAFARQGSTLRAFIDGQLSGTWADTFNYTFNTSGGLGVGKVSGQNGYGFYEGLVDETRVTRGVARYTESFPLITEPFSNYAA